MGDYYNMKLPQELADFFQEYIKEHKELGFRFVSQYALHLLQQEAKRISQEKKENLKNENKTITIRSGTYSKEDIKKLLENIKE